MQTMPLTAPLLSSQQAILTLCSKGLVNICLPQIIWSTLPLGPSSDIFGSQGLEETMEPSPDLALSGFSPDTFFALPPPDY